MSGLLFRASTTNSVFWLIKAETKDCVGGVFFLEFLSPKSGVADHPIR
jgi:hypothetical protein